jgi:hypothetical protein
MLNDDPAAETCDKYSGPRWLKKPTLGGWLPELSAPASAFYGTWGARALLSAKKLACFQPRAQNAPPNYFHFQLKTGESQNLRSPPLGWVLSKTTMESVNDQVIQDCATNSSMRDLLRALELNDELKPPVMHWREGKSCES